ncbi:MAG: GAF domain-containing protein [Acetobacteraceae bacterium]
MSSDALLELIYDGVTDDAAWTAALAMIAGSVRACGAGLGVQDMKTHEFWAVAESDIDTSMHETYQRLAPENRIWQEIGRARRPLADQMVIPKTEFLRSALHAEWFVPQGFHSVMAAPVMARGSHCGVVVTFGSEQRGDFDDADLDRLAHLARHLSRALGLRLDRARLAAEFGTGNQALDELTEGVLLLDGKYRLQYANSAGRTILNRRVGILVREDRLVCRNSHDHNELQKTLLLVSTTGGAPSEGWVVVHRQERNPLLVQVTKLRGAEPRYVFAGAEIMVRITDPDRRHLPAPALLRQLLNVTLSEARAVLATALTDTQEEAAAQLGVAKTTLRTQLQHVYQQLGVRERSGLLRLLGQYGFAVGQLLKNERHHPQG